MQLPPPLDTQSEVRDCRQRREAWWAANNFTEGQGYRECSQRYGATPAKNLTVLRDDPK